MLFAPTHRHTNAGPNGMSKSTIQRKLKRLKLKSASILAPWNNHTPGVSFAKMFDDKIVETELRHHQATIHRYSCGNSRIKLGTSVCLYGVTGIHIRSNRYLVWSWTNNHAFNRAVSGSGLLSNPGHIGRIVKAMPTAGSCG